MKQLSKKLLHDWETNYDLPYNGQLRMVTDEKSDLKFYAFNANGNDITSFYIGITKDNKVIFPEDFKDPEPDETLPWMPMMSTRPMKKYEKPHFNCILKESGYEYDPQTLTIKNL